MISTITSEDKLIRIIRIPNMPIFKIRENPYNWEEIKDIIGTNKLEKLARSESESERYLKFKTSVVEQNLTVYKYLLINQLKWVNEEQKQKIYELNDDDIVVTPKLTRMFTEAEDLKILRNDFPYHFEKGVTHLCIWTKFRIPSDPASPIGDISKETRAIIEKYLTKTFVEKYGIEWSNMVWFKNWESLQSVKRLSHIHVLIKGLGQEDIDDMLYGPGVPLSIEELEQLESL